MGTWVCIVEGDGDVKAIPILLRRLVHEKFQCWKTTFKPYNARGRENLIKPGGVENFVRRALRERELEA